MRIAIIGARGFVGAALVAHWCERHEIIACTRTRELPPTRPGLEWRSCDLFSLLEAEKALAGAEVAVYLANSFRSSAALSQGRPEDFDLILADNFMRAAARAGVNRVIVLTGEGRAEIEKIVRSGSVPWTLLRFPFVLGPGSGPECLLRALVQRWPVIPCPPWTRGSVAPLTTLELCAALDEALAEPAASVRDLVGSHPVSVRGLLRAEMKARGLRRWLLPWPWVSRRLSRTLLRWTTAAPKVLVRDAIETLADRAQRASATERENIEYWARELARPVAKSAAPSFADGEDLPPDARSVQRLPLPQGWNAADVAHAYLRWMPRTAPFILHVTAQNQVVSIRFRGIRQPFLRLAYSPERSSSDRQLFYVQPCLASRECGRGRLEFRETLDRESVLAAIHNFRPSLPWEIYRVTQALVHEWTMHRFARFLASRRRRKKPPSSPIFEAPASPSERRPT